MKLFKKKELPDVQYKFLNKHNTGIKKVTKAVCKHCLEKTTLRIVAIDGTNHLACTRCLKTCRFNKRYKPIQHPLVKVTHFTKKDYLRRTWYRIKRYFLGDHVYGPFKRKRRK